MCFIMENKGYHNVFTAGQRTMPATIRWIHINVIVLSLLLMFTRFICYFCESVSWRLCCLSYQSTAFISNIWSKILISRLSIILKEIILILVNRKIQSLHWPRYQLSCILQRIVLYYKHLYGIVSNKIHVVWHKWLIHDSWHYF